MKTEQREEAQQLFFQSNLTKTEIANKLSVSRRTIALWAHQGNWDQLRKSARNMPSILAEKCYHIIDHFATGLLSDHYSGANVTVKHAQTIHYLVTSIHKLKNRSTMNESMEMFNFFLDGLNRRNPQLAVMVRPEIEEYISCRATTRTTDHLTEEFLQNGFIPFPEKEIMEQWADEKEAREINAEFELFLQQREAAAKQAEEIPTPVPAGESGDLPVLAVESVGSETPAEPQFTVLETGALLVADDASATANLELIDIPQAEEPSAIELPMQMPDTEVDSTEIESSSSPQAPSIDAFTEENYPRAFAAIRELEEREEKIRRSVDDLLAELESQGQVPPDFIKEISPNSVSRKMSEQTLQISRE